MAAAWQPLQGSMTTRVRPVAIRQVPAESTRAGHPAQTERGRVGHPMRSACAARRSRGRDSQRQRRYRASRLDWTEGGELGAGQLRHRQAARSSRGQGRGSAERVWLSGWRLRSPSTLKRVTGWLSRRRSLGLRLRAFLASLIRVASSEAVTAFDPFPRLRRSRAGCPPSPANPIAVWAIERRIVRLVAHGLRV
jgi:hypothetical protein